MNNISLRLMTVGDLEASDSLRQLVGWNQTLQDWHRMLQLEPQGCFVALASAAVVGTVTTITYGQALAWIGMMLVHPEHRRQGIARRLMLRALEYLKGREIRCVKLDATPAGQPLYEQLGFLSEWTLTRWQRTAETGAMKGSPCPADTRSLEAKDWRTVEELDAAAFGVTRGFLLRELARDSVKAVVWPAELPLSSWGLLRPGVSAAYLGPLSCSCTEGARSVAGTLMAAAEGRPVYWDVPDQNEPAKALARSIGFAPVRPLTRMRFGPNSAAGDALAQFAIADPALG